MSQIESSGGPIGIKRSEVSEFNELVAIIVDYYCFKKNFSAGEEAEGDEWKKKAGVGDDTEFIIPEKIDSLIEKAFSSQLKKFVVTG